MRIKILKDTATVGRMLDKGRVMEVQTMLAEALIASGKAEDAFAVKAPKPIKAAPQRPEIVEVVEAPEVKPAKKKRAPAKKKAAAKKPARKKAKK